MVYGIILAGGNGSRVTGAELPKQFVKLGGKPLIMHSTLTMLRAKVVDAVIVVVPDEYMDHAKDIMDEYLDDVCKSNKKMEIIAGGYDRETSLLRAIDHVSKGDSFKDDIFVTHDACRPFMDEDMITKTVEGAAACGAATVALPCIDTMATGGGGYLTGAMDRSALYNVETPQTFKPYEYLGLLKKDENDRACGSAGGNEAYTDVTGRYIKAGKKVAIVSGDRMNFKITYDEDFALAEACLAMVECNS